MSAGITNDMRLQGRRIVRVVVALLVATMAHANAANWYLDKDAMGANTGTNWASAWTNYSCVQWGVKGVNAGDTLFISGGLQSKTYGTNNIRWMVGASGTSDAPITIRVGQDEGHNGVVIFDYDMYGDNGTGFGVWISRPWIRLDGEYQGQSHWQFLNFRNPINRATAYAVYGGGAHAVDIHSLTFSNCNQGIRIQNLQPLGCRIDHCEFLQIRGDSAITVLDAGGSATHENIICSNRIELAVNNAVPPDGVGSYDGPDGIQCCSWARVFGNTFHVNWNTNIFTSSQHSDFLQMNGTNITICNNEFINVGDSVITMGAALSPVIADVMIYNNVFRIEDVVDPYPEFIRVYGKPGVPQVSVERFCVYNNTFVDNPWAATYYADWYNTNFFGSFQFKNNIFYNCGNGPYKQQWRIANWPNYKTGDVVFEHNIYYNDDSSKLYVTFLDASYTASAWVGSVGVEKGGRVGKPRFVKYSPMAKDNNLRLDSSDSVARGAGVDLSAYFIADKDGNPRAGAWDIGAYQCRRVPAAPNRLRTK